MFTNLSNRHVGKIPPQIVFYKHIEEHLYREYATIIYMKGKAIPVIGRRGSHIL
jgi:hypothetical protein